MLKCHLDSFCLVRNVVFSIALCIGVSGCEDEVNVPDGALDEHTVDLSGDWKVTQALLNGRDITETFEFEDILLSLRMDQGPSSYELTTGLAPFPVRTGGTWAYNDLSYPTAMVFDAGGENGTVTFAEVPISGESVFKVSFGLGCADNVYTYIFKKN